MDALDSLVGKVVHRVWLDGSKQQSLVVDTDAGRLHFVVHGDCCSESWFYAITGLRYLLGGRVLAVDDERSMEAPWDGKSRQDMDMLYCYSIRTEKGCCDLEFRNSSNGYYGGWLRSADELDSDIADVPFVEITEDYIG